LNNLPKNTHFIS